MDMRKVLFFLPLLVLALVMGCSSKKMDQKGKPPAAPVTAGRAVIKDVPVQLAVIGSVEAYETVSIKSQVAGQIAKIHFTDGQYVRKGDLLVTIDPRPFEIALKQAEAALARDTVQMENAKRDSARYEELVKKGYVAQSQYEQVRAGSDALEAVVKADRAAADNARLQLSYCGITAPVSGRTGSLLLDRGNLVKANDDKAMVVINRVEPVNVSLSLPERFLPEVKKRMSGGKIGVSALAAGESGPPSLGRLVFLDNAVDMSTGTIKLKAEFLNGDKRLWPGQFVNTTVTLGVIRGAVVVPTEAIQTGQQGQYVYALKPDYTVELRPVSAGIAYEGFTVIEKGLGAGETVVTDGQMRLYPGAKAELKPASDSKTPGVSK